MITSTITTTIPAHNHLIMSLTGTSNTPSMEVNCEKIINDLVEITNKYQDWDDLVSIKIIKWSKKSLKHICNAISADSSNVLDVIQSNVNKLFTEVLISTYFKPLQNPILVNGLTIEREEYTQRGIYKSGKEKDSSSVKEHTFASEILKWGRELPIKQTEEYPFQLSSIGNDYSSEAIVPSHCLVNHIDIEKINSQLQIYLECEEIACKQLNMYKIGQSFKKAAEELQDFAVKFNERLQNAVDEAKLHADEEKNKALKELEEIRKSYEENLKALNELNQEKDDIINATSQQLADAEERREKCLALINELNKKLEYQYFQIKRAEERITNSACTIF